ncbi:hypothetical protein N7461_001730 [Penicillium sp. DV-2018c]|nr:hypothetical protein N7461_001730 [Penicillium sp. DV-2018c]
MKDHKGTLSSQEASDDSCQDEVADSPTQTDQPGAQEPRIPEGTFGPQVLGSTPQHAERRANEVRQDLPRMTSEIPSASEPSSNPSNPPEHEPQLSSRDEQSFDLAQSTVARSSGAPQEASAEGVTVPSTSRGRAKRPASCLRLNPLRPFPGSLSDPTMRTTPTANPLRPFPGSQPPPITPVRNPGLIRPFAGPPNAATVPGQATSTDSSAESSSNILTQAENTDENPALAPGTSTSPTAQSSSTTPTHTFNPYSDPSTPSSPVPFPEGAIPYTPRRMLQAWLVRQQRLVGIPETMLQPMGTEAHHRPANHRRPPWIILNEEGSHIVRVPPAEFQGIMRPLPALPWIRPITQDSSHASTQPSSFSQNLPTALSAPDASGDPAPPTLSSASVSESVESDLSVTQGPSNPDQPAAPGTTGEQDVPSSLSSNSFAESDESGFQAIPSRPAPGQLDGPGSPVEHPLDGSDVTLTDLDTAPDIAPAAGPQDAFNLQTAGSDNAPASVVTSDLPALNPTSRSDGFPLNTPSDPTPRPEKSTQHVAQGLSEDCTLDPCLIALPQSPRLHEPREADLSTMQDSQPENDTQENRETALQLEQAARPLNVRNPTDADSSASQEVRPQGAISQVTSDSEPVGPQESPRISSPDDLGVEKSSIDSEDPEHTPILSPVPDGTVAPNPSPVSADGGANADASPAEAQETSQILPVTFIWAQDDEDQRRERFVIDGTDEGLF